MRIRYVNYRKEFPGKGMGKTCFTKWFCIRRYWSGKIICIRVKHHEISLDFRRDWVADMMGKKAP